jgi:hypothetical protein
LARRDRNFATFQDLQGASIGIGPEGSGTAYLARELLAASDLRGLDVRLSNHDLAEQAELAAEGKLDLVAMVTQEDAAFLRAIIQRHNLDIVAPQDFEGLLARHPWLGLGRIPAGFYDVVHNVPSVEKMVARVDTLILTNRCARRAERIALLMLLAAELPGFVRANPPRAGGSETAAPLAPEARQFFQTGEPELADRYFPWLVNLMSPVYWVYFVMAATVLFNALRGFSRFRLWRIDAARERLERRIGNLFDKELSHAQMRALPPGRALTTPVARASARSILEQLVALRVRCQRQTGSFVTPMGDEMFYRYQEALVAEAVTTLGTLLEKTENEKDAVPATM